MKRRMTLLLTIVLALIAIPAFSEMTKKDLQKMYMDFLTNEGYRPSIDSDGDIAFKAEGGEYCIIVDEDDLEYFCLLYPRIYTIDNDDERAKAAIAAGYVNSRIKVAKMVLTRDAISIAVQIYVGEPKDFAQFFPRMLRAVQSAVATFSEKLKELEQ